MYPISLSRRNASQIVRPLIALLLVSSGAWASAVVFPKTSTPGAYEKYSLRVINEREVATVRVEIHFPPGLRVVSFGDVPGWQLQILADTTERITGAGGAETARSGRQPLELQLKTAG